MVLVPTPTERVVTSYSCLRRDDGLKESKAIGGVIRTSKVRVSALHVTLCVAKLGGRRREFTAYASRFLEAAGEFRISLLPHAGDVGGEVTRG